MHAPFLLVSSLSNVNRFSATRSRMVSRLSQSHGELSHWRQICTSDYAKNLSIKKNKMAGLAGSDAQSFMVI